MPPKVRLPLSEIRGIVMDMDGTTTTTEVLCIHALEYMVRQITNRLNHHDWSGLDAVIDYPNIIGNSTTRHVEYLVETYGSYTKKVSMAEAFVYAAFWTQVFGKDATRKSEVLSNIKLSGLEGLFEPYMTENVFQSARKTTAGFESVANELKVKVREQAIVIPEMLIVRVCIDIYYQRYHYILQHIKDGTAKRLLKELPPDLHRNFIEPMEGIGEFLALSKGLLGEESGRLLRQLREKLKKKAGNHFITALNTIDARQLTSIGKRFTKCPAKIAVVTSSIFFEADIVLDEVFRQLQNDVQHWDVSEERRIRLREAFRDYRKFYDGVVTASDSHEIRLKPHRDLYSIALYKLGLSLKDLPYVIGFEDSESGNIAIKAAGIGLALAVPFAQTAHHNLEAADFVLHGGIPEAILKHKLFLS